MQENPGIVTSPVERDHGPALLVPWTPWYRVFLGNLADHLLLREPPPLWLQSRPAQFWPDVFVRGGVAWRSMASSALYHVFLVVVVWGFSITWLQRPPVRTRSPFANSKITYYSVSEYLPEIDTGGAPEEQERKGEPAYAKQRIVSRPPKPDNTRQTIITPSLVKLPHEVPMPNIVAWTPVPVVPDAAITHSQLTAPVLPVTPVPPPPETRALASARLQQVPTPEVVAPAPSVDAITSKTRLPSVPAPEVVPPPASTNVAGRRALKLPEPSVIEPPVSADAARRPLRDMNVGHLDPTVAAPKLPVAEQRAAMAAQTRDDNGDRSPSSGVQPAPSLAGLTNGKAAGGQLIALGVEPAPVTGPISVPAGSRHGEFAATPEGKPGAPGTPEIKGGGTLNGNGAERRTAAGPPGISISPGPTPPSPGAVVSGPPAPGPAPRALKPTLLASLARSRVSDIARATRPGESVTAPDKIEEKVFGSKKFYSMFLNMPNLTSAGGSWIIRFAELNEAGAKGELTAPVATLKVDPAYPAEALRDHIEGTVTLFAIIHADGTVGEVRVLQGVDQRLDENARVALSRWRFRPGTKNGAAVELEAVVKIPFQARKMPF
jgi:TonB family protein